MKRRWECACGHTWAQDVVLSEYTPNLSGEATVWCPKCGQRPLVGSPYLPEQATPEQRERIAWLKFKLLILAWERDIIDMMARRG